MFCLSTVYSTEFPKSQKLNAGKDSTLKCAAEGYPHPIFKWYKNFKRIDVTNPRYTLFKNGSLGLVGVHEDDSGNYTCLITQLGEMERQREERKDIEVIVYGGYNMKHCSTFSLANKLPALASRGILILIALIYSHHPHPLQQLRHF